MPAFEVMECRSPRRCPSCEHWQASACALEAAIAEALAPRAIPIAVAPRASLASS